ncbi:hypothetical protein ACFQWA_27835 [Streptomyces thermogriseus]|uniref:DNA primase/polymerase bifunctional N-terminal domain-containing protein n=1 Tax=Streptomyces thermogriseus TaxID=75292 RepID=A0ABN1T138_9ACTN
MAKSSKSQPAPTWHQFALPSDQTRALWANGRERTWWAECGRDWDAVAISPLALGLEVLDSMRLNPRDGYPVLADYLNGKVYVLVPPGTGHKTARKGVRVLTLGSYLLLPQTAHGTMAAYWLSPLRRKSPLVCPEQLARHLQLAGARQPKAAAS